MCGRYALTLPLAELAAAFDLKECVEVTPRYNLAPLQWAPVIRERPNGERVCQLLRWGLVPSWSKDETAAAKLINARAETVATKPSFRAAYKARRCIVPASGFYEWKAVPGGKQPYYIQPAEGTVLGFAGLWERWSHGDGEPMDTFTIITTEANEAMRDLHERMPVVLSPQDYGAWLARDTPLELLHHLIQPDEAPVLRMHPVSKAVGNVRNDMPDLINPL